MIYAILLLAVSTAPQTLIIVQKHQIVENNSIIFLIEAYKENSFTDTEFYTVSQQDYNRLLFGKCEVKLHDNDIIAFNHRHNKCNYTEFA
jgi:hypothetical protein